MADRDIFVCAHRGASGHFPENTITAFEASIALGCGMVEFDVRATADGAMVVLHDAAVDRTTDGRGKIWELTLKEVKALDASAGHAGFAGTRIAELDETLDLLAGQTELNVHVYPGPDDGTTIVDAVCARIRERNLYETAFIAGSDEVVRLTTARDPAVRRCLLGSQDRAAAYPRRAHELGCSNVQPLHAITTRALCDEAHELGLIVHPYYADEEEEMSRLVECDVDGILTNQPKRMIEFLGTAG